jgi:hypothetical protein
VGLSALESGVKLDSFRNSFEGVKRVLLFRVKYSGRAAGTIYAEKVKMQISRRQILVALLQLRSCIMKY